MQRADVLLVARAIAGTRVKAQDLIRRGLVTINGRVVTKPSSVFDDESEIVIGTSAKRFVSRGGEKLDAALDAFAVNVTAWVVVDIGASTGGFTDCVLSRGARRVYAVDVGHDQLDRKLREDPRVVSREGTNARSLSAADFEETVNLVVADTSFISLEKLLPAIAGILPPSGTLVALIKPQFEVGREAARRTRGVVRDADERSAAIARVSDAIRESGFAILGQCDSALPGPSGNVESFVWAKKM